MTPADEKLGERFVRIEERQEELGRRMVEMQLANEKDHGEVLEILNGIRKDISQKAEKVEVKSVEDRTDKLESLKDKLWFIVPGMTLAGTFVVGFLLHITGGGS